MTVPPPASGTALGDAFTADAPGVTPRAPETRSRLLAWIGGALVIILAAVVANIVVSEPRPDARLLPAGIAPDEQILTIMANTRPWAEIDMSTFRAYEPYEGFEVFSAVNRWKSPCLILIHRPSEEMITTTCPPAPADVFVDAFAHGLPRGERIRFHLHGSSVIAYRLTPAEVDR